MELEITTKDRRYIKEWKKKFYERAGKQLPDWRMITRYNKLSIIDMWERRRTNIMEARNDLYKQDRRLRLKLIALKELSDEEIKKRKRKQTNAAALKI